MWYGLLIVNGFTKRQFLRVSEDYVQDWIDILSLYHSTTTLQELSRRGDDDLFKLIADMRETDDIDNIHIQLIYRGESYPSPMQMALFTNQIDGTGLIKPRILNMSSHQKMVSRYTLNNEFLNHYHSVEEAARLLSINPNNIYKCLRGATNSAGGYVWKWYENNFDKLSNL